MAVSNLSLVAISLSVYLSYKTQVKSAFPFGQKQILNFYTTDYRLSFAFSLILYPPESSVFVTSDLLQVFDLL